MPLAFAFAVEDLLASMSRSGDPGITVYAYLDDIVLIGPAAAVNTFASSFSAQAAIKLGVVFSARNAAGETPTVLGVSGTGPCPKRFAKAHALVADASSLPLDVSFNLIKSCAPSIIAFDGALGGAHDDCAKLDAAVEATLLPRLHTGLKPAQLHAPMRCGGLGVHSAREAADDNLTRLGLRCLSGPLGPLFWTAFDSVKLPFFDALRKILAGDDWRIERDKGVVWYRGDIVARPGAADWRRPDPELAGPRGGMLARPIFTGAPRPEISDPGFRWLAKSQVEPDPDPPPKCPLCGAPQHPTHARSCGAMASQGAHCASHTAIRQTIATHLGGLVGCSVSSEEPRGTKRADLVLRMCGRTLIAEVKTFSGSCPTNKAMAKTLWSSRTKAAINQYDEDDRWAVRPLLVDLDIVKTNSEGVRMLDGFDCLREEQGVTRAVRVRLGVAMATAIAEAEAGTEARYQARVEERLRHPALNQGQPAANAKATDTPYEFLTGCVAKVLAKGRTLFSRDPESPPSPPSPSPPGARRGAGRGAGGPNRRGRPGRGHPRPAAA